MTRSRPESPDNGSATRCRRGLDIDPNARQDLVSGASGDQSWEPEDETATFGVGKVTSYGGWPK